MKPVLSVSCLLLLLLPVVASCRSSNHGPEGTQEQFGVKMARQNLWREALFRFRRAVEISPDDAQAHNNLAVAYEANGEYELAAKEYREAMRLDKSNQYIQKNYSRLVEFNSRNKKRQRQQAAAKEAAAGPAAGTASAPTDTAGAPPVTDTAAAPKPDAPSVQGIGGSGAPPATKPVAVPPVSPAGPPPATDTAPPPPPPPPDPGKSGGIA